MGAADLEALRAHLVGCATCRPRLASLVPFLRRDTLGIPADLRVRGAPEPDLVPAVMQRLGAPAARARRRVWVPALAVAAALALVAGVGLLLYQAGVRRGSTDAPGTVIVRFELAAPEASSVALVGDFTDWGEDDVPLEDADGDGLWTATVHLRPGRAYSYNFLVDGVTWVADPNASLNVEDGYGGMSSVIIL